MLHSVKSIDLGVRIAYRGVTMEKYFVIGLFILVGVVVAVISLMSRKKSENQENQQTNRPTTHQTNEQPQAIRHPQRVFMGKYPLLIKTRVIVWCYRVRIAVERNII